MRSERIVSTPLPFPQACLVIAVLVRQKCEQGRDLSRLGGAAQIDGSLVTRDQIAGTSAPDQ